MGWPIILFGVVFITIFIWRLRQEFIRKRKLQLTGIRTSGIILSNKICWGRITVVRPIVQFQTVEGHTMELMDRHGVAMVFPRFSKGTKVVLLYDPANPANFNILSTGNYV